MTPLNFSSDGGETSFRTLPLIDKATVLQYTFQDLLKPGPQDVLQSTLPFYQLAIFTSALVLWIILKIYAYKFVYFEVNDPYATPLGSAPPWEKRADSSSWNFNNILEYVNHFGEIINEFRESYDI